MTLTLRARRGLAITASIAAAVTALSGCAGGHGTAAGSASVVNPVSSKGISASAPATKTSPAKPVTSVAKVNPATQHAKPPSPNLGLGQTGTRDQIPWSNVGTGWRLVQPSTSDGPTTTLYLFDPEGGRYLVANNLPEKAWLRGWSPDGQRALFMGVHAVQIELHTGRVVSQFPATNLHFISYTAPNGYAMLFSDTSDATDKTLLRIDPNGRLEQRYPKMVGGVGNLSAWEALYQPSGTTFVVKAGTQTMLMGNNAQPIRAYATPAGYANCQPDHWWQTDEFLETCMANNEGPEGLFLQRVAGGPPRAFVTGDGKYGFGYWTAFRLSNGDAVLDLLAGCGSGGYDVLHTDGTIAPLRLPAGVPAPGTAIASSGDLFTFQVADKPSCGAVDRQHLVDYDMVTGRTVTILSQGAMMLGYPSS